MVQLRILAGGFTAFIATYIFDTDSETLSLAKQSPTGEAPSWISAHPTNASVLYAVNEFGPIGNLQSFTLDAEGVLQLQDTVATGGNAPTFATMLSTGEVAAANYGSPNSAFVPTDPADPARFIKGAEAPIAAFPAPGGESNPHQVLEHEGEVFVPDLGADTIWRLGKDASGTYSVHGQIEVEKGSGPRHIAIHDGVLFTVHELASTLTARPLPAAPNGTAPAPATSLRIAPDDFPAGQFFAAELAVAPSEAGAAPLLYVSNRNVNAAAPDPRGDSIAIVEFSPAATLARRVPRRRCAPAPRAPAAGGTLTLVKQVFTGLQQVRSFAIGAPADGGDAFLVAGANSEGGIAVFRLAEGGRDLQLVARNTEVQNRTSFVWL